MTTGKDSKDQNDLEDDSTFTHIDESFDELDVDSDSVPFNLDAEDSNLYGDPIETDLHPKDFLSELNLESESDGQDDLNDMLRELEAGSEDSQVADKFEEELVELSQDDMLPENEIADLEAATEQQQFSFDDQDELELEDDTQHEAATFEEENNLDQDSEIAATHELAEDNKDNDMDQLLTEMEEEKISSPEDTDDIEPVEADSVAVDSEESMSGFQPMNDFDNDSEMLDPYSSESIDASEPDIEEETPEPDEEQEEQEQFRELNDDELEDALDNASYATIPGDSDDTDIPDSELTNAFVSSDEEQHEEASGFGEDIYAQTEDDSDNITEEIPETDESNIPSHIGSSITAEDWSESGSDEPDHEDETELDDQYQTADDSYEDTSVYEGAENHSNEEQFSEERPEFIGENSLSPVNASNPGGGSGIGLAVLSVIVAIGGASGFWYTTKIGGDVNKLKDDFRQIKNQVITGSDTGGVKERMLNNCETTCMPWKNRSKGPLMNFEHPWTSSNPKPISGLVNWRKKPYH